MTLGVTRRQRDQRLAVKHVTVWPLRCYAEPEPFEPDYLEPENLLRLTGTAHKLHPQPGDSD